MAPVVLESEPTKLTHPSVSVTEPTFTLATILAPLPRVSTPVTISVRSAGAPAELIWTLAVSRLPLMVMVAGIGEPRVMVSPEVSDPPPAQV